MQASLSFFVSCVVLGIFFFAVKSSLSYPGFGRYPFFDLAFNFLNKKKKKKFFFLEQRENQSNSDSIRELFYSVF